MDSDMIEREGFEEPITAGDFDIAIVGLAGRFPGARDLDEFWQNLAAGVEAIAEFTAEEARAALAAAGDNPDKVADPHYVRRGGVLDEIEAFDAPFFGIYPREAEIMDPQHRVFLELAWEALEHAGYDPGAYAGSIGVYAGSGMNTYLIFNLVRNRDIRENVQGYQLTIGNDKDYLPTRVAYKLNLRGPAVNVQTACSTSLVATHLACQALLNFQCDMALAGGVTIRLPQRGGYLYQEGGIASPDGHCRAFDADAAGTVGGNGAGIVVLKRLADALEQGDTIHAVIKGTAINNDGSQKVGYTAPSVEGQTAVIATAQSIAGVDPRTITYIEAHGTGTALGDPIEVAALSQVFREATDETQFCALGSLKTNVGHLDAAAGVAAVIKTTLALQHGQLPPSLNYTRPNVNINFETSPFYVNTELSEWRSEGPRRAGVSSFGIGGTNAHAVLEQAPRRGPDGTSRGQQLLMLTARTEEALDAVTARLAAALVREPDLNLADAAYTLKVGRQPMARRRIAVVRDTAEAIAVLRGEAPGLIGDARPATGQSVAFMFTGQGAQYAGMAAGLYATEPVFAATIDRCTTLLQPQIGLDIRTLLFPAQFGGPADADERLKQTAVTQPALFVIEYALAQLWLSWGVQPDALIGHSIGEYVAACLAEVLSLEDALTVVAARGRLMGNLPRGAMLSLPVSEEAARKLLRGHNQVSIATINAATSCVVGGPQDAVDAFAAELTGQGIETRALHTSHAFHTAMMDPILSPFTDVMRRVKLNAPRIPYVSNVSGDWITPREATDPAYYAQHLRQAVRFSDGIATLAAEPTRVLLEVGPGRTLATLAGMHEGVGRDRAVITSIRRPAEERDDQAFLLEALGKLWMAGIVPDWAAFYAGEQRRRIPLPTYPFERQRYWVEADASADAGAESAPHKTSDVEGWFYAPSWRRTPHGVIARTDTLRTLVLTTGSEFEQSIADALRQRSNAVTVARSGHIFGWTPAGYVVRPGVTDDAGQLLQALQEEGALPERIVVLWTAAEGENFEQVQTHGFETLLALTKAWDRHASQSPLQVQIVTAGLFDVTGSEALQPELATLLGPARVIGQEHPNMAVRVIDAGGCSAETVAAEIAGGTEPIVALRGPHRWVQGWERVRADAVAGATRLRAGGHYLITGGLGRIGSVLAQRLAQEYGAKLTLVDRSGLPPRAMWSRRDGSDERAAAAITRVQELEALGGEVLVIQADVARDDQMLAAVTQAEANFGPLNGVIHAAGTVGDAAFCMVAATGERERAAQFGPKIGGAIALANALGERQLDFVVLMSSVATVLGGLGFAAYAGANAFLDAFAAAQQRQSKAHWVSAAWDGWQFAEEAGLAQAAGALQFAIRPEEGAQAFIALQSLSLAQVVISTGDLTRRAAALAARANKSPEASKTTTTHARPRLRTLYTEPADDIERAIVVDWERVLGIAPIGANDDFFELGGHSLLATQLVSRLRDLYRVELPLRNLFESPTAAGLARLIRTAQAGSDASAVSVIQRRAVAQPPLSYGQQRLWFLDRLTPGSPLYNNFAALRLSGSGLDAARLEQSLNAVVQRHEVLRTVYDEQSGIPTQSILRHLKLSLPVLDLRALSGSEREAEVMRLALAEARAPFDLAAGPLLRATLVQTSDDEHILFFTMHHIVSDGWSVGVLVDEVAAGYRGEHVAEPGIQYADYAAWQRDWLAGEIKETQLAYWRSRLGDYPDPLELPTDRPRPPVQTSHGANYWFELPKDVHRKLEVLAQGEGATLFMALTAALQTLLHRYTGQDDIAIGTPVANRDRAETAPLIGFLLNTLVLRTDLSGAPTFRGLLGRVKQVALGAYAHQDIPFELLVEELQPPRDMSRSPFFQVMFDLQAAPLAGLKLPGVSVSRLNVDGGTAKFDLALSLEYGAGSLGGFLNYNTDLFDRETIAALVEHFRVLLTAAVAAPDMRISDLPLLTEAERQRVLVEWNSNATPERETRTVVEMFEAQAAAQPEQPALLMADGSGAQLTYADLNAQANQIARRLRDLNVRRDEIVALLLHRTPRMMAAIMGVLKAGAAFLPIDPTYPAERIRYTIEDAGCRVLLAQQQTDAALAPHMLALDAWQVEFGAQHKDDLPRVTAAQDAAYVIYTSGSTGLPKGVVIEHGGLAQHLTDVADRFGLRSGDRVLQFAAYTFDQGLEQILTALTRGCALVMRGEEIWAPADFPKIIAEFGLTSANLPPAYWNQVLQMWVKSQSPLPAGQLRTVISGGDVLSQESLTMWQRTPARTARLINAYGPTETTVTATTFDVPADWFERSARPTPIGRPLPNRTAYIVDRYGNPTPPGVPGELLLGGNGVARGYLHRPALTTEKFLALRDSRLTPDGTLTQLPQDARLYRTGDLVRAYRDGTIEFIGRIDQQVKIRGFRVELGEIEAALLTHSDVRDAAVIAQDAGDGNGKRLIAYLAGDASKLRLGELRDHVGRKLPAYMTPAAFVVLDELPRNASGKVDRRSLPAPDSVFSTPGTTYVAPRTPVESELTDIWGQVLRVERVGVDDNFFELGGHSLLATQIIARLREHYPVELPLQRLFERPTVAGLAAVVEEALVAQQGDDELAALLAELDGMTDEEARKMLFSDDTMPQ